MSTRRQVRQFLDLPRTIYPPDGPWVAPPDVLTRLLMGNVQAPDRRFWLALDRGRPVARLGAQIPQHGSCRALHFGFFECLPGCAEAASKLFERAGSFAPELEIRGPFHFRLEDPYPGLLVQGFEEQPIFLMPYHPPYYEELLRASGFEPVMDLYSYLFLPAEVKLDRLAGRAGRAAEQGISVTMLDRWRRGEQARACLRIANQAWAGNWGFEPIEEDQVQLVTWFARLLVDRKGILLARHQGREVGFLWVLPDFNRFLKPARGRITWRLVWDLLFRRGKLDVFRGHALGVLPEYRDRDVTAALVNSIMGEGSRTPWRALEVSWVLADNSRMNAMARALGGRRNKIHRLFRRPARGVGR
ncbi:MAG: hypothetical protein HY319_18675 [Armatimonadetes bacterium]|nr:hypothetical protein [Armatimonadota bacterium]